MTCGFAPRCGNSSLSSSASLARRLKEYLGDSPLMLGTLHLSKSQDQLEFVALWRVVFRRNEWDALYDPLEGIVAGRDRQAPRRRAREAIRRLRSGWYAR